MDSDLTAPPCGIGGGGGGILKIVNSSYVELSHLKQKDQVNYPLLPPSFPLFQRIFFFLLWYLSSFVWALTAASQAKLFRFALQHLFGRTKFSVSYNGQGLDFVL